MGLGALKFDICRSVCMQRLARRPVFLKPVGPSRWPCSIWRGSIPQRRKARMPGPCPCPSPPPNPISRHPLGCGTIATLKQCWQVLMSS